MQSRMRLWVSQPFFRPLRVMAMTFLMQMPLSGALAQLPSGVAVPVPGYRPVASYEIDVKLDMEAHTVSGYEVVTFRNTTTHPVTELWFHNYYNAWKTDGSTWLTLNNRKIPADYPEERLAWLQVTGIVVEANMFFAREDILETFAYIQPDDGNEFDQTLFRVELPRPLPAGGEVRLRIDFTTKVPRTFSRTGYIGDNYFLAQWFPKIGVLTDNGWEAHQYFPVEYFADYGTYDVRLNVPSDCVVGATGVLVGRPDLQQDGTTTHRFRQEMVHDFAWTAWPQYLVFTEEYEFLPGYSTEITLLLCPEHKGLKDRYLQATRYGIRYYSEWFGPYPYTTTTIVDPAFNSGAGGMEYPTFFTGGAPLFAAEQVLRPEGVTIHEFGHQYWYGIVGNNETVDAWLDEGFNSYSESRVQDVTYGHNHGSVTIFNFPVVLEEVEIPFKWAAAPRYRSIAKVVPLDVPSYLKPRFAYGGNAYSKGELMHWTLEGFLGWETYREVLSTYYERWKFRHPVSEDFFMIVNEVSGMDMTWFFDQLYHSTDVLDYAVEEVFSSSREEVRGSTVRPDTAPEGGPEWTAIPEQIDQRGRITQVTISRPGEVIFPVEILVQFDDGRQIIERWDGVDRRHTFTYEGEGRIQKVVVDPREIVVLDINRSNNSWISAADRRGARKLTLRWFFWMQSVLEFFAFIS